MIGALTYSRDKGDYYFFFFWPNLSQTVPNYTLLYCTKVRPNALDYTVQARTFATDQPNYTVVETDYTSFVVVYTCGNLGGSLRKGGHSWGQQHI